jgi:hypothetical protein
MSTITDEGRKIALEKYGVRLLPTATDKSHLIAASASWGPFVEGDYISIALTEDSYIATGDASVVATTDDILLPVGIHDFAIPAGVTHVALISEVSDAVAAIWGS